MSAGHTDLYYILTSQCFLHLKVAHTKSNPHTHTHIYTHTVTIREKEKNESLQVLGALSQLGMLTYCRHDQPESPGMQLPYMGRSHVCLYMHHG